MLGAVGKPVCYVDIVSPSLCICVGCELAIGRKMEKPMWTAADRVQECYDMSGDL